MSSKLLFGFHAVGVRLKTAPASVNEVHVDASRRDAAHAPASSSARKPPACAWSTATMRG
jgi:hypothetical protein